MAQQASASNGTALEPTKAKTKAERAAERLARLSPWKPGQSGNPLGAGVLKRRVWEHFRQFMSSPSDFSEVGESNRLLVWKATVQSAVMGEPASQEVLIKHDLGNEEGRLALAEHIRKVARDRAELALGVLGARVHTMTDAEKVEFFNRCACDAREFLAAAEAELEAHETRAVVASPAVEQAPALAEPIATTAPPEAAPDGEEDDE